MGDIEFTVHLSKLISIAESVFPPLVLPPNIYIEAGLLGFAIVRNPSNPSNNR